VDFRRKLKILSAPGGGVGKGTYMEARAKMLKHKAVFAFPAMKSAMTLSIWRRRLALWCTWAE
jgi:hypothetical protein